MINLRVYKIIKHPLALLIVWLIYLISPIFDIFRCIHVDKISSKSLKYLFYLLRYLCNGGFIIFLLILATWIKDYYSKEISSLHKKILITVGFTCTIFVLFSRFLVSLEVRNYPNYLYSVLCLPYEKLRLMSDLGVVVLIVMASLFFLNVFCVLNGVRGKNEVAKDFSKFREGIVIAGFLLIVIWAFFPLIRLNKLIKLASESYQEKYGIHYKYIPILAEFVPKDGKIIHPPQGSKWYFIGNQPMIRYFLYPRILISGALINNQEYAAKIGSAYFAEIDADSLDTHWPIIDHLSKIVIFDEKNKVNYEKIEIVANREDINIFKITF